MGSKRTQRVGELSVRCWTVRGTLREATNDDGGETGGDRRTKPSRRDRRLGGDLRDQRLEIARLERRLTGQQPVHRRADGVNVSSHVERLATELLGRGELRSALESFGVELVAHVARQRRNRKAEIADLHRAVEIREAVRWLDVAMENAG